MYSFGTLEYTHSEISNGVTTEKYALPLLDASGSRVGSIFLRLEDLAETLVELLTVYDFAPLDNMQALAPPGLTLPISNDWDVLHVDHHENMDGTEQFSAAVCDGDTGAMLVGYGICVLEAVADLARNLDFKTRLPDEGKLGLRLYLDRVHYGLERRSNEILMEEMEGIVMPEKGAW